MKLFCLRFLLIMLVFSVGCTNRNSENTNQLVIFYNGNAGDNEVLAAKELQRYLYLRTGILPEITTNGFAQDLPDNSILIGTIKSFEVSGDTALQIENFKLGNLGEDDYLIKSTQNNRLLIIGGGQTGVLYGAYKFLESTGIGFTLHGDIIPDQLADSIILSGFDEIHKPAFSLRGILPFHDFPEGPDWWTEDDYEAIIAQLPKMGMNWIGFHTYPEKNPWGGWEKAEPMVWIGTKEQFNEDGTVNEAYPVLHSNTGDSTWAYYGKNTSEFNFGAAMLFETDVFGAPYMKNISPWPHTEAENVEIFNEVGRLLNHAFTLAKDLGVKTVIGTETPLTIPQNVKESLKANGMDPDSEAAKVALYEGIFSRIKATHPLDYYWFWTPETWTWDGANQEQVERTKTDLKNALTAARNVAAPFTLATSGWVLGPPQDRAGFDNLFPKEIPFSVINREVGFTPVEPAFADIQGRPLWQISWIEDDPAMITPQFWAGRVRKDAVDALKYGVTGMMGIHWRTEELSPAFMALARAGWEADNYTDPVPDTIRDYDVVDLYQEWAKLQFGEQAAEKTAKIFNGLDGGATFKETAFHRTSNFFRTSDWGEKGPGRIKIIYEPWEEVQKQFAFIEDFEACEPMITGTGNKERYQYWLNTFYYAKTQAHIGTILRDMEDTANKIKETKQKAEKASLAANLLSLRSEAAQEWEKMVTYLLQTVNTTGAMGTLANLELHSLGSLKVLNKHDSLLNAVINQPIPVIDFSGEYKGKSRLAITTKRTLLKAGEDLTFKVRVLSNMPVQEATIFYKPIGSKEDYKSQPLDLNARKVYDVHLTNKEFNSHSFEYYIIVKTGEQSLRYPAGNVNQSVVVW